MFSQSVVQLEISTLAWMDLNQLNNSRTIIESLKEKHSRE